MRLGFCDLTLAGVWISHDVLVLVLVIFQLVLCFFHHDFAYMFYLFLADTNLLSYFWLV